MPEGANAWGTFFFTVVTCGRRRFLDEPENVALLKSVFQSVMAAHPFLVDAMVVSGATRNISITTRSDTNVGFRPSTRPTPLQSLPVYYWEGPWFRGR